MALAGTTKAQLAALDRAARNPSRWWDDNHIPLRFRKTSGPDDTPRHTSTLRLWKDVRGSGTEGTEAVHGGVECLRADYGAHTCNIVRAVVREIPSKDKDKDKDARGGGPRLARVGQRARARGCGQAQADDSARGQASTPCDALASNSSYA